VAHHKSAIKRIKTSEKSRIRNKSKRTSLRTMQRKLATSDAQTVVVTASKLVATADRAARKGIIHKNKASRLKSQAQKKAALAIKAAAK